MSPSNPLSDAAEELIRIQRLPRAFAEELDASVRAKYLELWQAVSDHADLSGER